MLMSDDHRSSEKDRVRCVPFELFLVTKAANFLNLSVLFSSSLDFSLFKTDCFATVVWVDYSTRLSRSTTRTHMKVSLQWIGLVGSDHARCFSSILNRLVAGWFSGICSFATLASSRASCTKGNISPQTSS